MKIEYLIVVFIFSDYIYGSVIGVGLDLFHEHVFVSICIRRSHHPSPIPLQKWILHAWNYVYKCIFDPNIIVYLQYYPQVLRVMYMRDKSKVFDQLFSYHSFHLMIDRGEKVCIFIYNESQCYYKQMHFLLSYIIFSKVHWVYTHIKMTSSACSTLIVLLSAKNEFTHQNIYCLLNIRLVDKFIKTNIKYCWRCENFSLHSLYILNDLN